MSEEIESHVLRKYDIIQKIGKGTYGVVWKALDRKTEDVIALKKIYDAFRNGTDSQRTYREVMFLLQLKHKNIVKLLKVIKAENKKDIYLVFNHMQTDLHAVIRANILEEVHKQYVIYQLLKALKYVHSAELIHRDIKPANILLNSDCHLELADFGLARSIAPDNNDDGSGGLILTEYVASRWYRAPEILLGSTKYTKAVDMWAVGCILGELIVGKAIFPGTSTLSQLEKILEVSGKPKLEDIAGVESQLAANILASISVTKKKTFQTFFPKASETAQDLLKKLLCFNPQNRITAEEALKHKYVEQFSSPEEELPSMSVVKISMNDNSKYMIREYRDTLYSDISRLKKEDKKSRVGNIVSQYNVQPADQSRPSFDQQDMSQSAEKIPRQGLKTQQLQSQSPDQIFTPSKYDNREEKGFIEKRGSMLQQQLGKGSFSPSPYIQSGGIYPQKSPKSQPLGPSQAYSKQTTFQMQSAYTKSGSAMINSGLLSGGTPGSNINSGTRPKSGSEVPQPSKFKKM